MGRAGWPAYYETLGDAIEDAERLTAKIKTNKYTSKDVVNLARANAAIMQFILEGKTDNDKSKN